MERRRKAVVVGGGYAGALAAARLVQDPSVDVTLVAPRGEFVHRVRLYRRIARRPEPRTAIALAALLGPRVDVRSARVERIDPAARTVHTTEGAMRFDALIVATGSSGAGVPSAATFGGMFVPVEQGSLERLRTALPGCAARRASMVVVGGGPTAVELAGVAATDWPGLRVTVVSPDEPLSALGPEASRRALARLRSLGVVWRAGRAVEMSVDEVGLNGGASLRADIVVWATGVRAQASRLFAPDVAPAARQDGRVVVLPTLQLPGHPEVFVVGDAAAVCGEGGVVPMGCKTAMPMAAHAADNVLRVGRGMAPSPFSFVDHGACVAIGSGWALGLVQRGPQRLRSVWSGRIAGLVKALLCWFVLASIRLQARGWLRYRWPGGPVFQTFEPAPLRHARPPMAHGDPWPTRPTASKR